MTPRCWSCWLALGVSLTALGLSLAAFAMGLVALLGMTPYG